MAGTLTTVRQKGERLKDVLEARKGELQRALPRHITADRLVRTAITSVSQNPKLLNCTPVSVYSCLLQLAQLGLEPGVQGRAYLIPYKENCQVLIGYQGLLDLARRSGEIAKVTAHVVYPGDRFEYIYGSVERLEHRPAEKEPDNETDLTHAYAVAWLRGCAEPQIEVMPAYKIEEHRKRSPSVKAKRSSPWDTDYAAMAKKTVLRQLCKLLPASVELQTAVALDEQAELGIPQDLPVVDVEFEKEPKPEIDPETGEEVPPAKKAE